VQTLHQCRQTIHLSFLPSRPMLTKRTDNDAGGCDASTFQMSASLIALPAAAMSGAAD
jgi:hypothetical protein